MNESTKNTMENIPFVGKPLQKINNQFEALRPTENDDKVIVVAKRTAQTGIIVAGAALLAVAVL